MKKASIYKLFLAVVLTTTTTIALIAQGVEGVESIDSPFSSYSKASPQGVLDTYCEMTYGQEVQPITRVVFAGIDNVSDAGVNNSPGQEYFLELAGNVQAGERYEILVEGNTNGDHRNAVAAYIDWNQNGVFEESERFDIGILLNSTGTDGKTIINTIIVPDNALSGATRMRVIKRWPDGVMEPCIDGHVGQAEDYTLIVSASPNACEIGSDGTLERIEENLQEYIIADDFYVEGGHLLRINQIELNLFSAVNRVDVFLYDDNDGNPGTEIKSFENIAPSSMIAQGEYDGHTLYSTVIDIPKTELVGDDQGRTYWIGFKARENTEVDGNFLEKASSGSLSPARYSEDGGETWTTVSFSGDIAMSILATCLDSYNPYSCTQEYYTSGTIGVGVRHDDDRHFIVANDFIVESETTFNLSSIQFWLQSAIGDLTTIEMNIYTNTEDNGVGEKLDIDPESYTVNIYPDGVRGFSRKFAVELTFNEPLVFLNETEENQHYWVGISAGNSTEDEFVFWSVYLYDDNPSHPTWNSLDGGETWKLFEQSRTGNMTEGQMYVYATCNEPTVSTSSPELSTISVYPNPVNNILNFKTDKVVKSVSIFNLQGQEVMVTESTNNSVNLSELNSGLFIARFTFKDGSAETIKFLKH